VSDIPRLVMITASATGEQRREQRVLHPRSLWP
jgi:hypothetical protein